MYKNDINKISKIMEEKTDKEERPSVVKGDDVKLN